MKKINLILVLSLFSTLGFSQMVSKTIGTPSDFKKMMTKTLVVEILEEGDGRRMSKVDVENKKDFKALIKSYNAHIKAAVEEIWTLNKNIEYKTSTEVDEIIKNKNDKYVLLSYYEHKPYVQGNHFSNYAPDRYRFGKGKNICVINYISPSTEQQNPEIYAGLPARFVYKDKLYRKKDLVFALRNLQNNINEIVKENKHIKPDKYIIVAIKGNCQQLLDKTFLLNKSEIVKKFNLEKAKKAYAYKFKLTESETIEMALENKETDKVYSVILPVAFLSSSIISYKLVVDVVSGDILSYSVSSKADAMSSFNIGDLKRFSKCK